MRPDTKDFTITYTGRRFHFLDPDPQEIHMLDIAWALAHTPRWGGHTTAPYSVAQHSVVVASLVREAGGWEGPALYALLHDASEAYLGDIPAPVKRFLPDYKRIEATVQEAIYARFGLRDPGGTWQEMTDLADIQAFRWEARDLLQNGGGGYIMPPDDNPPLLMTYCAKTAMDFFTDTWGELEAAMV